MHLVAYIHAFHAYLLQLYCASFIILLALYVKMLCCCTLSGAYIVKPSLWWIYEYFIHFIQFIDNSCIYR